MGDLTTLPNENLPPARGRTPALPAPELSVEFLARLKEIVEVLLGQRGSTWDRAVTFRDLNTAGIAAFADGPAGYETGGFQAAGEPSADAEQVDALIRKSKAYRELTAKVGVLQILEGFPDEIRTQLSLSIADLARDRQADIQSVERRIQTDTLSIASRLTELTASLEGTAAGVREFDSAYADGLRAVALRIEQVAAEIDGGGSAEIEQRLEAIADLVDGLSAQYSLKVQTNPVNGQPPVIAGISLSANSPVAGPGTSSLIFLAQTIQFLTDAGAVAPFSVVGNQVKVTNLIAEALKVVMADGTVVLDAGKRLAEQTPSSPNLAARISSWGTSGGAIYVTGSGDTRFINGEYLYLPANQSTPLGLSNPLNIPANSVYTVSFDAYVDSGTKGVSVNVYGVGIDSVGGYEVLGTAIKRYRFTETMPNNPNALGCKLRIYSGSGSGNIVVSNIKVEMGSTATSWSDNVITKQNVSTFITDAAIGLALIDRATITNLSAIVAFLGSCELGIGGALWAGQTDYDVGNGLRLGTDAQGNPYLSMRSASGKYIRIRPSTDTFEFNFPVINNPQINGLVLGAFTASLNAGALSSNGANGTRTIGSRTLSLSGGDPPYSDVSWSITGDTAGSNYLFITGDGTSTVTVRGTGTNVALSGRVTGSASDRNGRIAKSVFAVNATFGTPA